ncbi:MAG: glycosyltransferase family 4 protein [Pseudomonadota bacterium]
MNLAVLCNLPPPAGGAEVFSRELAASLADLGVEMTLITQETLEIEDEDETLVYPFSPQHQTALYGRGIRIVPRQQDIMAPQDLTQRVNVLADLLEEFQPDLLHCHMPTGLLHEACAIQQTRSIPVVSTMHGMMDLVPRYGAYSGPSWSAAIIRKLMQQLSHNVVVSEPMLDYCRSKALSNVTFIPTGLPTDYFAPSTGAARSGIVYVGKLNRFKGLRETLSGFLRVANSCDDRLHLVGRGLNIEHFDRGGFYLTARQQARVKKLIESGRVVLHGEITPEELRQLYRNSRVLALPSRTEGMPLAILEALSCGAAVVASRVGSVPRIIRDGENGMLCRPGNITEFAAGLRHILRSYGPAMEIRCRDSVVDYDMSKIARRYLALFEDLLRRK